MTPELLLAALRREESWDAVSRRLGAPPADVRRAVDALLRSRVPAPAGEVITPGPGARVGRDSRGVPHIFAASEAEAYYGLGFAMGQDRLWQMDYLRRAGSGTLAEVLGPAALETDRASRILGLRRVAAAGAELLGGADRDAVEAFCGGVNLARALALRDGLPFEFALLEYEPEPWTPVDTLAVLRAFWWQLTGRFPVICVPEFARRMLGRGPLLDALLAPEGDQTTIWPRGVPYPDLEPWRGSGAAERGPADGDAPGSNNWVVSARRSAGGAPLLCSDPHVPFALPSVWYEARLRGGAVDACGALYCGVPGIFFGRNRDLAWGLTNNISSLRDLYLEVTDDFDPSRYRRGAEWRGMQSRREEIRVRGEASVELEVRSVDHGPIVSDILPGFARCGEEVSLRWVGHEPTTELETMLAYVRAASPAEFRTRLRGWSCPSFNFVMAGRDGTIGYQLTGSLPLRPVAEAGYRSGDDPRHAWAGRVPFEALPAAGEPPEGWLGSANNIVAVDWPYPLSGTWPSDHRMQRLVNCLNQPGPFTEADMARLQNDEYSTRAARWAASAVAALRDAGVEHPLLAGLLEWDHVYRRESRAAGVFETFFLEWSRAVLGERLPAGMLPFLYPVSSGLVETLLEGDAAGWFARPEARTAGLAGAWSAAVEHLEARLGRDDGAWRWDALHTLTLRHPVASTAPLRELLERGPVPHGGGWNTLSNSLYEPDRPFESTTGASYRLLADLAGQARSVIPGGQSGHPGSPHYADQLALWQEGGYHPLELSSGPPGALWLLRPADGAETPG